MVYKSQNGNIELRIVGYDEPNNSRELHIAELWINSESMSDSYFESKWNRLNFNLAHYQFESEARDFVFIPAEGNSFVINTHTLQRTELAYKGLSTSRFKGNKFSGKLLIVYYTDETIEIDLI